MFDNAAWKEERLQAVVDGELEISERAYNAIIGIVTVYGFAVNVIIVSCFKNFFMSLNPLAFLIGYFLFALLGCSMAYNSRNCIISFIGYNFLVIPVGGLLSVCLSEYSWVDIQSAMLLTGVSSTIMLIVAILTPDRFIDMGNSLLIGLISGLLCEMAAMIIGYSGNLFNWFFVIIFSLYIAHDFSVAQMYPKTIDNAVDSALDIYLDIINLFIRILSIIARSKNND